MGIDHCIDRLADLDARIVSVISGRHEQDDPHGTDLGGVVRRRHIRIYDRELMQGLKRSTGCREACSGMEMEPVWPVLPMAHTLHNIYYHSKPLVGPVRVEPLPHHV